MLTATHNEVLIAACIPRSRTLCGLWLSYIDDWRACRYIWMAYSASTVTPNQVDYGKKAHRRKASRILARSYGARDLILKPRKTKGKR